MVQMDKNMLDRFKAHLEEQECSCATIKKYCHDVQVLSDFCHGEVKEKAQLIAFKKFLQESGYAASSINSMLAATNRFLTFVGYANWKLRFLKIQRSNFVSQDKELSRIEYEKMVRTAQKRGDDRMSALLQTICTTGIRVSEIRAITVESLRKGRAELHSKGKIRFILLPRQLCKMLKQYCKRHGIIKGYVFVTKRGHVLNRSNIWRMMKNLAKASKIEVKKVFPHNLRHLFARCYYKRYKDIVRLADILGHSSINTTRIYTTKSQYEQQRQMECLCLLI